MHCTVGRFFIFRSRCLVEQEVSHQEELVIHMSVQYICVFSMKWLTEISTGWLFNVVYFGRKVASTWMDGQQLVSSDRNRLPATSTQNYKNCSTLADVNHTQLLNHKGSSLWYILLVALKAGGTPIDVKQLLYLVLTYCKLLPFRRGTDGWTNLSVFCTLNILIAKWFNMYFKIYTYRVTFPRSTIE